MHETSRARDGNKSSAVSVIPNPWAWLAHASISSSRRTTLLAKDGLTRGILLFESCTLLSTQTPILDNSATGITGTTDAPHLYPHHLKLLPFLAQRFIPKRHARAADAPLQDPVEPESVSTVAAADAQERLFAENEVIVDAAIGECFEADALLGWCAGAARGGGGRGETSVGVYGYRR